MNKSLKNIKKENKPLFWLLFFTFLALIPQYLMRGFTKAWWFFYNNFTTYPGDLWYCFEHYLSKGYPYPREYPAGIQVIFRLLYHVKPLWANYERYMFFISVFLGIFALIVTYFIYLIVKRTHKDYKKIIIYWIFTPSFMFYGLLNFEFACIFFIMIAYYFFIEEDYYLSACFLSLGTSFKVFPIFLAPLFFFQCPKKYRLGCVVSFILIWLAFNGPFILFDFKAWSFPYVWQIQNNYATSIKDGSYWWLIYKGLTSLGHIGAGLAKHVGKFSLVIFGSLYFYLIKKYWHLSLARKCIIVILLFLLTDRIYSPQYNLYLLPFLVLSDYKIDAKYFYMAEIPNMLQVFFLFYMKHGGEKFKLFGQIGGGSPIYLQALVFIKYIALIFLLIENIKKPIEIDTDKAYINYLKSREDIKK